MVKKLALIVGTSLVGLILLVMVILPQFVGKVEYTSSRLSGTALVPLSALDQAATKEDSLVDVAAVKLEETNNNNIEETIEVAESTEEEQAPSLELAVPEAPLAPASVNPEPEPVVEVTTTEVVPNVSTTAIFTTPSGVKIDANGNVLNDDGEVTLPSNNVTANSNSSATLNQPDVSSQTPPPGVFVLPSGVWVDRNGNIVEQPTNDSGNSAVTTTTPPPTVALNGVAIFTTPSGAQIDAQGNIISTPDSGATAPVVVATTGDSRTKYIRRDLRIRITWNEGISCESLGLVGSDLSICNLYRNNYSDYTWIEN